MKRPRPVPAYKARLAQRAERMAARRAAAVLAPLLREDLAGRALWDAQIDAAIQQIGDRLRQSRVRIAELDVQEAKRLADEAVERAAQAARAKARKPSFFHELAVALGWRRGGRPQ